MKFPEISPFALDTHSEFNSTVWGETHPSFHNKYHVLAVQKAGQLLIDGIKNGSDPLSIQMNLQKWNRQCPDYSVDISDFCEILDVALALHDLGNICKNLTSDGSGNPEPEFFTSYTSKDAEKRGIEMSRLLISISDLNENNKKRYSKLIQYLIGETTFDARDITEPFSQIMRVIDQIGSRIFCQMKKTQMERGLLEEMIFENPEVPLYNPDYFFNFPRRRIYELGLNQSKINELLNVWEKTLPNETPGYVNTSMSVNNVIRMMD